MPALELVQGTHLVLDGPPQAGVYYLESPRDGRAIFVMPWRAQLLVGTTEVRFHGDPGQCRARAARESLPAGGAAPLLPRLRDPVASQVRRAFAGLRVLPAQGGHAFHRSRETLLIPDRDTRPRLLSIYGGKLTTWRAVAARALLQISAVAPAPSRRGAHRPAGTASVMSRGVLALDQGSHASRACIFDESGVLCATRQRAGCHAATRGTARRARRQRTVSHSQSRRGTSPAGGAPRNSRGWTLAAAGLAVQRSTIVCCSRLDGAALSPAISWQDRRNAAWLEGLAPHAGTRARAHRTAALTALRRQQDSLVPRQLPVVARAAGAGELLAAPLASYLALQLKRGTARADAARVDAANAGAHPVVRFAATRLVRRTLEPVRDSSVPGCRKLRRPVGHWGTLRLPGQEVELRAVTGDQSAVPYAAGAPDTAPST